MDLLHDLLFDYTIRTVALGAGALGLVAGAMGTFAVLRRQSLLGDAISHAALPGIVLAFIITGMKGTLVLVLGAALAGWLGTLAILMIIRHTRLPEDSALGIVLSVFFGAGLVLLTHVQRLPTAAQAGLETFPVRSGRDHAGAGCPGDCGARFVAAAGRRTPLEGIQAAEFDPEYGATQGLPMRGIDVVLTTSS
jgi:manganese/zinc/iron transport system permease protein